MAGLRPVRRRGVKALAVADGGLVLAPSADVESTLRAAKTGGNGAGPERP